MFVVSFTPACETNVHKRCQRNVANNCGINSRQLADILNDMGMTPHKLTESSKPRKKNVDASARTTSSSAVTAGGGAVGSPVSAGSAAAAVPQAATSGASKDVDKAKLDPEELKIMDLQIQAQREMDARLNKRGLPNGGQGERASEKQPGEKTMPGEELSLSA